MIIAFTIIQTMSLEFKNILLFQIRDCVYEKGTSGEKIVLYLIHSWNIYKYIIIFDNSFFPAVCFVFNLVYIKRIVENAASGPKLHYLIRKIAPFPSDSHLCSRKSFYNDKVYMS